MTRSDHQHCVVDDDVGVDVDALRSAIRASALIGESQLVGAFESTRGFGIACHLSAVRTALARAPWLGPFVDVVTDADRLQSLLQLSLLERLLGSMLGDFNALYLNVLVVPAGGAVARHVDSTLGVHGDGPVFTPRAVGVLYVDVPDDLRGGELRLFDDDDDVPVASIVPRAGRLVLFRGSLGHEVTATSAAGPRVSCVAELYALPRARLALLPRVRVQSRGFQDVMARLRRR
ncbi:MAG: 2OG-Fe(II) oxygenase [Deltaproteobacteria bacterium]|nr:2OG-Fe(II) oxygenase [Deltaproteobacteria bacterium]